MSTFQRTTVKAKQITESGNELQKQPLAVFFDGAMSTRGVSNICQAFDMNEPVIDDSAAAVRGRIG